MCEMVCCVRCGFRHINRPEAFAKVTVGTCKAIISKVFKQEEKYWADDEKLDEIYSENAEEEYLGKDAFENQGDEFYLEAV
ncbi:MAG: hypothetical protein R6U38_02870 [Desulfatiglandaceae bacterium]